MDKKNDAYTPRPFWKESARIIWAIISKDILEAIKNKNTLAILLTAIPMIFVYYYLPVLEARDAPYRVRIYNAGDSILPALLENNAALDVRSATGEDRMKWGLQQASAPELGLVIPDGFDQSVSAGEAVTLQGYIMNWFDMGKVETMRRTVEAEIDGVLNYPVEIQLASTPVYLTPDSGGMGVTGGIALVFVVILVGFTLIPHLMLEEKSTRTIDALRVSPANAIHLVLGKAAVGLLYCLLGAAIAIFVFRHLILQWWLALLAIALGSLFAISIGLFLGNLVESRAQLTLWSWVFILPMFLPMFGALLEDLMPAGLGSFFRIFPSTLMLNLLRISYVPDIPWGMTFIWLAGLSAWVVAGLSMVIWLVRRQEHAVPAESIPGVSAAEGLAPLLQNGNRLFSPLISRFDQISKQWLGRSRQAIPAGQTFKARRSGESRPPRGLRLVWVIAAKDIRATIKNKLAISIMLGSAVMVISNLIPMYLLRTHDRPTITIYDQGRSTIVRALGASDKLRMNIVDSLEEMQADIATMSVVGIGVALPEDFDRLSGSSELINLEGYYVHWADPQKVASLVTFFEEQLGAAVWGKVHINVEGHLVYPPADLKNNPLMVGLIFTVVLLTMGVAMVPLLMVEERQSHTLEVLLISPASRFQILVGKGLAGMFYCLLAAIVILGLNQHLVVHWGVALLLVLMAGLFAVAVGLLIGALSDNPTTVGLWGLLFLVGLLGLSIVYLLVNLNWSPLAETLFRLVPSTVICELFSFAVAGTYPAVQLWLDVSVLAISTLLVSGLALVALRRMER